MRKYLIIIMSIAATAAAMLSCSKEEDWGDYQAEMSLSMSEMSLGASGDLTQYPTYVTSDYPWKVEWKDDWINLSTESGDAGETRVIVKADDNAEYQQRSGEVYFRSGASRVVLKVTQSGAHKTMKASDVPDYDKIYIPSDVNNGYLTSEGSWYFGRSIQSEHFILFWASGYGEYGDTTPSDDTSTFFHVDLEDLLDWAEKCYAYYIDTLHFTDRGSSQLDKYKFTIYLHYSRTWAAYGWGLDDVAGCLWLNSDAAHYKSTIAHEIGHSFQYQVYCDQLLAGKPDDSKRAFRYSQGSEGSDFWEQTAQWVSFRMCPDEVFTNYYFSNFCSNAYRHFSHEDMRYGSYFLHYYWTDKYGDDAVAQVWRTAAYPDDPIEAYQHLHGLSTDELNDQLYEFAAHCATFDFNGLADEGLNYLGKLGWIKVSDDDGWYRVSSSKCPEATGFNVDRIYKFTPGGEVTVEIQGLPGYDGYVSYTDPDVGGWTLGFVQVLDDGSRVYSPAVKAVKDNGFYTSQTCEIESNCAYLYAVVCATPSMYIEHGWDNDNSNDPVWPYKLRVTGANF